MCKPSSKVLHAHPSVILNMCLHYYEKFESLRRLGLYTRVFFKMIQDLLCTLTNVLSETIKEIDHLKNN